MFYLFSFLRKLGVKRREIGRYIVMGYYFLLKIGRKYGLIVKNRVLWCKILWYILVVVLVFFRVCEC